MFKKKNAQGMSITVIIVAIIALIVLVAVIMIFSGKFDDFRSGIGKAVTCEDACKVIGMDDYVFKTTMPTGQYCIDQNTTPATRGRWKYKYVPGKFGDVDEGKVCCCRENLQ